MTSIDLSDWQSGMMTNKPGKVLKNKKVHSLSFKRLLIQEGIYNNRLLESKSNTLLMLLIIDSCEEERYALLFVLFTVDPR